VRVTTDRQGFAGGAVLSYAGPWRTSGEWWNQPDRAQVDSHTSQVGLATCEVRPATAWDRDEWEVALADGACYRIFRDRAAGAWFIDAIFD